jgi:hypothetical protein
VDHLRERSLDGIEQRALMKQVVTAVGWRIDAIVCSALYAGFATRTVGIATATRTRSWLYRLKKGSPAFTSIGASGKGRGLASWLVPGPASARAGTAETLQKY